MSKKNQAQQEVKSTTRRTLYYYWREIVKYKWYTLGCIILTPIVVFIRGVLAPMIFADLIDLASQDLPIDELIVSALSKVITFILLYLISKVVFEELRLYLCWKMEMKAMYDLSILCFDTISEQSMQFHNDRFSGSLVSQSNKFVSAFERLVDVVIWNIIPTASFIIMIVVILLPQVPWFAVGLIVLTFVYALICTFSFKKIAYLNEEWSAAETKQTGQLSDSISNIISVKSYAKEDYERERYAKVSQNAFRAGIKSMRATIGRDVLFNFVQIGITCLILAFLLFGRSWLGISIATLVLIVNYAQTIQGELWSINSILKNINRVFGDAREMTLILDTFDDVVDAPDATPLDLTQANVEFQNVTFQHSDAKSPIFENFTLNIKPGERVGLVGTSGSGKTTLTKLLLRFADVNNGSVRISSQDIKNLTQKSLREAIAYVPQETSLFHRSIAENIAYGKPDATATEIQQAAKLANAHDFIMELPDGYNTLVGERGIKLSGGQRQRIAIARAILKNAPILVLDEATSALDSESEALIQDALNTLMKDRTSLVIAHRLSTVANLDRIIVLENGKIVEQGPHQELLKSQNGVYHQLWSRQSGAFMDEK